MNDEDLPKLKNEENLKVENYINKIDKKGIDLIGYNSKLDKLLKNHFEKPSLNTNSEISNHINLYEEELKYFSELISIPTNSSIYKSYKSKIESYRETIRKLNEYFPKLKESIKIERENNGI